MATPPRSPDVAHGRAASLQAIWTVRQSFPEAVLDHVTFRDEETIRVDPARLVDICRTLKADPGLAYVVLTDITATHFLEREYDYEVAYLLYSLKNNSLLRLKLRLSGGAAGEPARAPSVTGVWSTADWLEREEWDKVGVVFEGHPNLKRILMPEDWEGHPLRRDYPVEGIGA